MRTLNHLNLNVLTIYYPSLRCFYLTSVGTLAAAHWPAVRVRDVRCFHAVRHAEIRNRRTDADRPLAVLPAPQRPCQGVQGRVIAPFVCAFIERPVRA